MLIDLLADDAEIVVARDGDVVFVRTVRMPSANRPGLGLSPASCDELGCEWLRGIVERVILWGLESVHSDEKQVLADASGSEVEVVDPFSLVDVDSKDHFRSMWGGWLLWSACWSRVTPKRIG